MCVCDLLNVLNKKPVLKHKGHVQKNNYPLSPLYLVQLWNWQMMNNSRFLNQRLQQYITNTSVEAIINGKWSIPYKKKTKKTFICSWSDRMFRALQTVFEKLKYAAAYLQFPTVLICMALLMICIASVTSSWMHLIPGSVYFLAADRHSFGSFNIFHWWSAEHSVDVTQI